MGKTKIFLLCFLSDLSRIVSVIALFLLGSHEGVAQTVAPSGTDNIAVSLTTLFNPVYPPLPLQAGISGDVEVKLLIRPSGTVEAAEATTGHPLLRQAAIDSAIRSQFDCSNCGESLTVISSRTPSGSGQQYIAGLQMLVTHGSPNQEI
jgi:hypothetical protein